jgi:ribosomal protein L7/L12
MGEVPGRFDDVIASAVASARARGERPGKIPVIKVVRERTGAGLKEAKDAVEDYGRRHGVEELTGSPGSAACVIAVAGLVLVGFVFGSAQSFVGPGGLPPWAPFAASAVAAGVLLALWWSQASQTRPEPLRERPRSLDEVIAAAVADARARGERPGKIPVIKVVRERTGAGLKEAKDAVEDYGRRHGVEELT